MILPNNKSCLIGPLISILALSLFSLGCSLLNSDSETEENDCPIRIGIDPDPPRHCYTYKRAHLSWSPDGKYIAYLRGDETVDETEDIGGLYIYDLINNKEQLVILGANDMSSQAWSPDGEWLVFGVLAQIYKVRVDGSDLTRLTQNGERDYFAPAWSPDGQWVAYSDRSDQRLGSTGLWIMRSDGDSKRWLTKYVIDKSWASDGNLFIARNRLIESGNNSSWVYEIVFIDGENGYDIATLWTDPQGIISTLDYSFSNSELVFYSQHRFEGDINIWKINADGSGRTRLTFNGGAYPAWSPDGSTIAYVNIDYFEGGGYIWLMDADGTNQRPMIEKGGANE